VAKKVRVEYVWLDGKEGMPGLRSKARYIKKSAVKDLYLSDIPRWTFDGGSTNQGTLEDSDKTLIPVKRYSDPFHKGGHIVLCEVLNHSSNTRDELLHSSNTRDELRCLNTDGMLVGFEQEFTLMNPATGDPIGDCFGKDVLQERFYCGVGPMNQIGRWLMDEFEEKVVEAGVDLYGVNAEVMPGQWEFQISEQDPLDAADDLWMARYILERVAESRPIVVSYEPKPSPTMNGAGCHTNISTVSMMMPGRGPTPSMLTSMFKDDHKQFLMSCGEGTQQRLTGECETSNWEQFSVGVGDRGASIRIPKDVATSGSGYFEDRRPSANCDPYRVLTAIMNTMRTPVSL
jgi:glutamine synthetase